MLRRRERESDPRADEIAAALDAKLDERRVIQAPGGRILNRGLYKLLPSILEGDEEIIEVGNGYFGESLWKQTSGKQGFAKQGYVVLTDRRLVFLATAIAGLGSRGVESIPLSRVLSVDATRWLGQGLFGIVGAPLTINTGGGEIKVRVSPTAVADKMSAYVRSRIGGQSETEGQSGSAFAGQLRELAELRDAGIISAEDFETKKAQILRRL